MQRGVIAAGSPQTAEAGAAILRAGGNAVDAAVAAAFASFIAEASISSPGGGGFALLWPPDGPPTLYDFFCAMPGLNGDPDARNHMDFTGVPIDFGGAVDTYYVGRGSTAVPGNPAGLLALLRDAGTLPLPQIVEPAAALARDGFPLDPAQALIMRSIENVLTYTDNSRALFAPQGDLLRGGETFRNPALAATLERMARGDNFYTGDIGRAIVDDSARNGGLLTADDLAQYRVIKRDPLAIRYRGRALYTNPPPSAGGILIAYGLELLQQADMSDMRYHDAAHVRLLVEIMRQTNIVRRAERPSRLSDPTAWDAFLDPARATRDFAEFVRPRLSGPAPALSASDANGFPNTTHISAADASGLVIAISLTPGATGGYVVGETGVMTNNILGERDLNPAGFHAAQPGTRLISMMAPTGIELSDGGRLILGSAGSSRLRTAILQVLNNAIDWDLPLGATVNNARVHFNADQVELEFGYLPETAAALENAGYAVNRWQGINLYFGGAQAALTRTDGTLQGAGDARRGGAFVTV